MEVWGCRDAEGGGSMTPSFLTWAAAWEGCGRQVGGEVIRAGKPAMLSNIHMEMSRSNSHMRPQSGMRTGREDRRQPSVSAVIIKGGIFDEKEEKPIFPSEEVRERQGARTGDWGQGITTP